MPVKTMAQRQREREEELRNPSGKGWRNAVPAKRPTKANKMTRSKLFLETQKLYEKIAVRELAGVPLENIALELRLSKAELRRHRNEPVYKSMLEQGAAATKKRLETKLDALTDQALDVHGEIMKKPKKGDPVRLSAATSILDRTLAKPKDGGAQETRSASEHHLHLHASPEDVATVAKRLRAAAQLAGHLPADAPPTALNPKEPPHVPARTEPAPADPVEAEGEAVPE